LASDENTVEGRVAWSRSNKLQIIYTIHTSGILMKLDSYILLAKRRITMNNVGRIKRDQYTWDAWHDPTNTIYIKHLARLLRIQIYFYAILNK
jgi:hypothetical protein